MFKFEIRADDKVFWSNFLLWLIYLVDCTISVPFSPVSLLGGSFLGQTSILIDWNWGDFFLKPEIDPSPSIQLGRGESWRSYRIITCTWLSLCLLEVKLRWKILSENEILCRTILGTLHRGIYFSVACCFLASFWMALSWKFPTSKYLIIQLHDFNLLCSSHYAWSYVSFFFSNLDLLYSFIASSFKSANPALLNHFMSLVSFYTFYSWDWVRVLQDLSLESSKVIIL